MVSVFKGGMAFDSAEKRPGSTPVAVKLVGQLGSVVQVGVSIDANWFANPDPVFPVTIDPWTVFATGGSDTYLNTSAPNTPQDGQGILAAGVFGSETDRTFLMFTTLPAWDPSLFVSKAEIKAFNSSGMANAAKTMRVYPVSQFVYPNLVTWNNPPTVDPYVPSTTGVVPAGTGTGNGGWTTLDATPLVRQRLTTGNPAWGVSFLVAADNEGDTLSGKNFHSREYTLQYGTGSAPALQITYKTMPTAPTLVAPVDQASVATTTPTLTANLSNSDTGPMKYWFELATGADGYSGTVIYASGWQQLTPVAGKVSWTIPAGYLENGGAYYWTVRSFDGEAWSNFVPAWKVKIDLRLGASGPSPFDQIGPVGVNLANGNVNFTSGTQSMPAVGGSVGLRYSYNSQAPATNGLTGTYFNSGNWTGTPAAQRRETTLWNDWGTAPPVVGVNGGTFSSRYTGTLTVPATNVYPGGTGTAWKFAVSSHAGVLVKINGVSVYDSVFNSAWWNFGSFQYGSSFTQAANATSTIQIDFFGNSGGAAFDIRLVPMNLSFDSNVHKSVGGDWLQTSPAALPKGWDVSADDGSVPYTRVVQSGNSVSMVTSDGQVDRYTWNGTGYVPDSGLTGHLAFNWTPGVLGWDYTDGGFAEHFDIAGNLAWAFTTTDDRKPAALVYVYSSIGTGLPQRLTQVKDPVSNRSAVLKYAGGGCPTPPSGYTAAPSTMLCQVDFTAWGTDTGRTDFFYLNGQLARVDGVGSGANRETTKFGYDSSGRITSIQSPLATDEQTAGVIGAGVTQDQITTKLAYDSSNRVSSITLPEPAPTTTLNPISRPTHTYTYPPITASNTATVSGLFPGPVTKVIRSVTWDPANLHQLTDTDATGHTTTQTWDLSADAVASVTDAAGLMTTTIRDQQRRPTHVYGPAPVSWFTGFLTPATGHGDGEANPMPHAQTAYDVGISGLAATWYNTNDLTGNPVTHSLWNGSGGYASQNWGTTPGIPAPGINPNDFSGVMTGEVLIPYSGANGTERAQFQLIADDGAQLFVDDQRVIDKWAVFDPAGGSGPLPFDTVAGSWHRIRILFREKTLGASFTLRMRQGSTPAFADIPITSLTPRYDLVTSTSDPDGHRVDHSYSGGGVEPQNGLEYETIQDPLGLNLKTKNTYEPASTTTYFRPLTHQLPKGASSTTTDTYYGATETRAMQAISGCPTGTYPQAGFQKLHTDAAPGAGPAATTETIYNAQGQAAFTRQTGDSSWACTNYDSRLRPVSSRDTSGKVTTNSYAVPGTVTTTYTDSGGTSRSTIAKVDLLGRGVSYTDEQGTVSTTDYDVAGRVIDTWRKLPGASTFSHMTSATYDDDGRVLTTTEYVSLGAGRTFTTTYDAAGRAVTFDRPTDVFPLRTTTAYDANTGRVSSLTTNMWTTQHWVDAYGYSLGGNITLDWSTASLTTYAYDNAGRLTTAAVSGGPTRNYAFDANTNRCAKAATCAAPTYTYDNADRLTASPVGSGYVYDQHGNLTSYTKAGGGTVTMQYDANDHATRIDDGTTHVDETLSPSGRVLRRVVTSPSGGTVTEDTTFGYAGGSDSPAWAKPTAGGTVTTYLGGDIITGTTPSYQIANAHGDIVATMTQSGTITINPPVDEYGVTTGTIPGSRLGWLGSQQRFTTAPSLGIIRMGVRLYDPNLGRFLEADPVLGGSCNDYDYVCADPINASDLDGTRRRRSLGVGPNTLAWCAKYGIRACSMATSFTLKAKDRAKSLAPTLGRRRNAFQHIYWMALVTKQLGRPAARSLGLAHELDTPDSLDHLKDIRNNYLGRVVGSRPGIGSDQDLETAARYMAFTSRACNDERGCGGNAAATYYVARMSGPF